MKPQWDPREILRYLGADHATPLIQELMERAQRETEEVSRPKSVFLPLPIQVEEDRVFLGEKAFASKSLASISGAAGRATSSPLPWAGRLTCA